MSDIEESIAEVQRMIPEYGFNVCYYDDFAEAGEKLALIKHCETRKEAEKIVADNEDEPVYIYEAENESGEGMSNPKNHNIDKYLDMALQDFEEGTTRDNDRYENTNYGGEAKSLYGIQNMLDDIVAKSLGEGEKKEIEESEELQKDFSLNTLLGLIADRLSKKIGKKLGVEAKKRATEAWDDYNPEQYHKNPDMYWCPECTYQGTMKGVQMHARDVHGIELGKLPDSMFFETANEDEREDYIDRDLSAYLNYLRADASKDGMAISEDDILTNMQDNYGIDRVQAINHLQKYYKGESYAGEGGRGSGRRGHQKWMLAGEAGEECENCMMLTDRDDDGKCILCGN